MHARVKYWGIKQERLMMGKVTFVQTGTYTIK